MATHIENGMTFRDTLAMPHIEDADFAGWLAADILQLQERVTAKCDQYGFALIGIGNEILLSLHGEMKRRAQYQRPKAMPRRFDPSQWSGSTLTQSMRMLLDLEREDLNPKVLSFVRSCLDVCLASTSRRLEHSHPAKTGA